MTDDPFTTRELSPEMIEEFDPAEAAWRRKQVHQCPECGYEIDTLPLRTTVEQVVSRANVQLPPDVNMLKVEVALVRASDGSVITSAIGVQVVHASAGHDGRMVPPEME